MTVTYNNTLKWLVALILVYVALFSLSLFAFVLVMMSFDIPALPARHRRAALVCRRLPGAGQRRDGVLPAQKRHRRRSLAMSTSQPSPKVS